jgi:hypothetical protein
MQIDKVRLPDGRVVRPEDWKTAPYYSTVEINRGPQGTLDAFSSGLGGEVPGSPTRRQSTLADTNLEGAGGFVPENEELLIFGLHVELFTVVASTALYLVGNDVDAPDPPEVSIENTLRLQRDVLVGLKFTTSTERYLRHPMGLFPAAMGVYPTTGTVTNAIGGPIAGASNGGSSWMDARDLATPHKITGGVPFTVPFEFPFGAVQGTNSSVGLDNLNLGVPGDPSARIRARVYLRGYRMDPVA